MQINRTVVRCVLAFGALMVVTGLLILVIGTFEILHFLKNITLNFSDYSQAKTCLIAGIVLLILGLTVVVISGGLSIIAKAQRRKIKQAKKASQNGMPPMSTAV
ncbi:hypothetical protein IWQ60_002439 [Tieghemiomyces parasiticus]|uniref:Uncharacterized protein n=1 Tax=Tieghemiomyces parasiticus TaxID=78921 RepID=A0A9W8ACQ5_9FUNG|nr:hypothetical protein IWQ60_002439 [Tieghemiomyces parasiticus]